MDGLTLFIEGDGAAWTSPTSSSTDPTPRDPLALRLALAHPEGVAAYVGRPCQFVAQRQPECTPEYWTRKRYSREVVDAVDAAIDVLKARFDARHLTLVGYSGGGSIAALVAARRTDVVKLVTIAANLDHERWTSRHRVDPLIGSLNAADVATRLRSIPQWHFVGGRDKIVGLDVVEAYAERLPPGQRPAIVVEKDFDHRCCWVERWPALWALTDSPPAQPGFATAQRPAGAIGETRAREPALAR
ncbi:MAG: alpha/beta hydrolase [Betaproteobacteria bacterium]